MNKAAAQTRQQTSVPPKGAQSVLRRKCDCGIHTIAGEECAVCAKKSIGMQRKLAIGTVNDPLEQEADRVAEQVLAAPLSSAISVTPTQIQRLTGQPTEQTETAPASVERVLSSPGSTLDPALRQDMEQRFGRDFSQVRVHTGSAAAQSAQDVRAHAYTVGHNIVFGAGQFAPGVQEGRRILAHELTHVVQQTGSNVINADHRNQTRDRRFINPAIKARQQSAGPSRGEHLQRWSWAEIKERAYGSMIAGIHKARDGMRNGLKRLAAEHLPASLYPIADGIIEVAVTVVEILVSIIMAVLGIVVGFGEGIVGMIEGLFALAFGVIKLLYDLIAGIFTNFDAAKQDLKAVWEALKGLPAALKKLVTDWLDKFSKASSERQSLMIGELTGQVLAIIATYALAAGRAGSAAKTAGTAAETASVTGDVVTTAARTRPALTVIEGGGAKAGSAGVRASAGAGATETVGNTALKIAPEIEPVAPPLRLLPPVPAEAAPAVAPAAAPAAVLAPGAGKTAAIGSGIAAVTATNLASQKAKKPKCGSPTGLTRSDAISMTWYKVREDDYYPRRLSIRGQVYGRDDPSNPRKLPLGEPLGVPNKYWPRLNKIMQLLPAHRGPNADRFRSVLAKYGFDWSGLQADHVQDLDWSGPDEFENLWPLSDSANLSAGPRQNSTQKITYCETAEGPRVVDQTLASFKAGPGHFGRFFRIAKVER